MHSANWSTADAGAECYWLDTGSIEICRPNICLIYCDLRIRTKHSASIKIRMANSLSYVVRFLFDGKHRELREAARQLAPYFGINAASSKPV